MPGKEGVIPRRMSSKGFYHVLVHVPRSLAAFSEVSHFPSYEPAHQIKSDHDASRSPHLPALLFALDKRTLAMFSIALLTAWALLSNRIIDCVGAAPKHDPQSSYIEYSTVTGYFLQDEPSTNASTFSFLNSNFGLINRTYASDLTYGSQGKRTQWQRFANQVFRLNRDAPQGTQYKLLYMGRHGEGYHNAAESYYGTPAWNCYYSELDGNGSVTWADAHLTPRGIAQAHSVNTFWASEIKIQKIPTPQSYYTSPLTRSLATANLTFSGLKLPSRHPFIPIIKELFREGISGHTCDRRGSKSYIQSAFPSYKFEPGFPETDQLWEAYHGETQVDQDIRSKSVLDDVFSNDRETYVSLTSHSGEIASILRGESVHSRYIDSAIDG